MSTSVSSSPRTGQTWVAELRGELGGMPQIAAHHDLANYLYVIAYNYLRRRQVGGNPLLLHNYAPEDLAALAQDAVQELLLKLARNEFALLTQFSGHGSFEIWIKRVLLNLMADDLRHAHWHQQERSMEEDDTRMTTNPTPEQMMQIEQLAAMLRDCLEQLDERRRFAFEQCISENRRAKEVAPLLQTTENGVNQLVYRARLALRHCMEQQGVGPDVLALFARQA